MTNVLQNTPDINKENKKTDFSKMSEQELIAQLQSGNLTKEKMVEVAEEIAKKKFEKPEETLDVIGLIKKNQKNINKEDLKKLLNSHIREYAQKNSKNLKQGSNIATKKLHIDSLMAQLNDEKENHKETKEKYNKLLMADEKIITPIEYARRQRLRKVNKKLEELKRDPAKALTYFLTRTSIWKGGKATAKLKQAGLRFKSLSSFSTMGSQQIKTIHDKIQAEIGEIAINKNKDSTTVQRLKENIQDQVIEVANKHFQTITQPINKEFKKPEKQAA